MANRPATVVGGFTSCESFHMMWRDGKCYERRGVNGTWSKLKRRRDMDFGKPRLEALLSPLLQEAITAVNKTDGPVKKRRR